MINHEEVKTNYRYYFYTAALLACLSSFIYVKGFWGVFDINIFSYGSLFDIVKFASTALTLIVIITMSIALIFYVVFENTPPPNPNKVFSISKLSPAKKMTCCSLTVIFSVIIGVITNFAATGASLSMVIIFLYFANSKVKKNEVIFILIFFGIIFLALDYDIAKHDAKRIIYNKQYQYTMDINNVKMKYLGHYGNYDVFSSLDNSEKIFKRDMGQFELKTYNIRNKVEA